MKARKKKCKECGRDATKQLDEVRYCDRCFKIENQRKKDFRKDRTKPTKFRKVA